MLSASLQQVLSMLASPNNPRNWPLPSNCSIYHIIDDLSSPRRTSASSRALGRKEALIGLYWRLFRATSSGLACTLTKMTSTSTKKLPLVLVHARTTCLRHPWPKCGNFFQGLVEIWHTLWDSPKLQIHSIHLQFFREIRVSPNQIKPVRHSYLLWPQQFQRSTQQSLLKLDQSIWIPVNVPIVKVYYKKYFIAL